MQSVEQIKTRTTQKATPKAGGRQGDPARTYASVFPVACLYFAYGSNLNLDQMAGRCPTAQPLGPITLPGWRLEFRSVADIVPCVGAEVVGALYRIEAGDELALDRYEGFRRSAPGQGLYRKVTRRLQDQSGRVEPFMFYVMNAAEGDVWPPQMHYLQTIRQGYADWHLPIETLEEAVLRSYSVPPHSVQRGQRWESNQEELDDFLTGDLFGEEYDDV